MYVTGESYALTAGDLDDRFRGSNTGTKPGQCFTYLITRRAHCLDVGGRRVP